MMTWNSLFFQSPSSNLLETVILMHDFVMMFLVTVMLAIMSKFTMLAVISNFSMEFQEDHQLETVWTIVPFLILVIIALPSLNTLYMLDTCVFCGLSVLVTGHQWYWSYSIKNMNVNNFDSYMEKDQYSFLRLIDTDNRLLVPSMVPMRLMATSGDVIHSWTIPSLGFKMDAIPGRLNQICMTSKKSGIYFGQCSEICGSNHSFMPIVVESYSL